MMKTSLRLMLSFCLLSSLYACTVEEGGIPLDCSDPLRETIAGIVIDNYTSMPIQEAKIHFFNNARQIEQPLMTLHSDELGAFFFAETGCTLADELLSVKSVLHEDYDGFARQGEKDKYELIMYKERPFHLIFINTEPEVKKKIEYDHRSCLQGGSLCYAFGKKGTFVSSFTGVDTIVVQVPEGEAVEIEFKINDGSWFFDVSETEGENAYLIEY